MINNKQKKLHHYHNASFKIIIIHQPFRQCNKTDGARTSSETREAEWPCARMSFGTELIPRPPKTSCRSAPQWDTANVPHMLYQYKWAVDSLSHSPGDKRACCFAVCSHHLSLVPPLSFLSRLLATCFPKCQCPGLFWGRVYCVSSPGDAVRLLAGGLVTETGHPALPSMCSLMYWGLPACLSCEWSYVSFLLEWSVDWAEACHPPRKVSHLWLFCCMQTDPSCGNIHARWWQGPMCQQTGQTNWAIWRLSAQIFELVVCISCGECKHVAMIPSSLNYLLCSQGWKCMQKKKKESIAFVQKI